MEARIARLESDVAHLRTDVADIKIDVRALRDKMDAMNGKLSERIEASTASLTAKIDSVKDSLAATKVWALALYVALAGSLFATLARGFGWV
jgi:uncharacterized coiled-coil protein SlyX